MMDRDEIQKRMKANIEEAKNNPEFQAASNTFKEETQKYTIHAADIEEIKALKAVFGIAKEEAENLQRDILLGEDAE